MGPIPGSGRSPGQEDPLEEEMATCSSLFARRIPRTEEPGGLQFMESQRVRLCELLLTGSLPLL